MITPGSLIVLDGITYSVIDAEVELRNAAGEIKETKPIKVLSIRDGHSSLEIRCMFSIEQFEEFISKMEGRRIIASAGPLRVIDARGG